MSNDLKSFKKDWQRWTRVERLTAIALLAGVTAVLGGPLTMGIL